MLPDPSKVMADPFTCAFEVAVAVSVNGCRLTSIWISAAILPLVTKAKSVPGPTGETVSEDPL